MQRSDEVFQRQIWLVNNLLRSGKEGLTLKELDELWTRSSLGWGGHLNRATFNHYRDSVRDLYGIDIVCNLRDYSYHIANPEVLKSNNMQTWMLRSLTVSNVMQASTSLSDRILLEPMPMGQEFLQPIIDAMTNGKMLNVTYFRAYKEPHSFTMKPYCLKVFRQRWYLVGQNIEYREGDIRVYALDRLLSLKESTRDFVMPEWFVPNEWFEDDFGVFAGIDTPVEDIVIRAYGQLPKYLRSLPLHESQRETMTGDEYCEFTFHLRPTYDFRQELLSQADEMEVVSPLSLRKEIRDILTKARNRHIIKREGPDEEEE